MRKWFGQWRQAWQECHGSLGEFLGGMAVWLLFVTVTGVSAVWTTVSGWFHQRQ